MLKYWGCAKKMQLFFDFSPLFIQRKPYAFNDQSILRYCPTPSETESVIHGSPHGRILGFSTRRNYGPTFALLQMFESVRLEARYSWMVWIVRRIPQNFPAKRH